MKKSTKMRKKKMASRSSNYQERIAAKVERLGHKQAKKERLKK